MSTSQSQSQPPTNAPQNAPPTKPKPSLDADIALLQKLLSADAGEPDPENVAALLKRLDAAEGLASGVEERLDGIIDHLDALLGDLEADRGQGTVEAAAVELELEAEVRTVDVVAEVSPGKAEEEPSGQKADSK